MNVCVQQENKESNTRTWIEWKNKRKKIRHDTNVF